MVSAIAIIIAKEMTETHLCMQEKEQKFIVIRDKHEKYKVVEMER